MPSGVYIRTEEHRKKLSNTMTGCCKTEEHKRNISKGQKGIATVFHSEETRGKISENMTGNKHWNWQGGITATYNKRWREKNYEKVMEYNRKRMVMKKGAEGTHTLQEWEDLKKKYDYMCLCCKCQEPEIKLTRDHIIPLTKEGSDYIDNIQPLCGKCNSQKYNKIINYLVKKEYV